MLFKIFSLLIFAVCILAGRSPNGDKILTQLKSTFIPKSIAEDAQLDVIGLLKKYGYPSETHIVQTEDGYMLTMHRITAGKGNSTQEKPVVFLMHGLFMSSADWINAGPNNGFGYLLADKGYDVWMGNARGNFYSRSHKTLSPKDSKFWKFSWDEIGYYDLPAMINRVLEITGKSQIHYAGHSQGSTTFFVMTSMRPEFNTKIKSMHALAPVAYMSRLKSPLIKLVAPWSRTVETFASFIGKNEFLPTNKFRKLSRHLLCKDKSIFQPLCTNILFLLCGFNDELLNKTMLPIFLAHAPAGASSRQFAHYAQEQISGKFRKYDFNIGNWAHYESLFPPEYPLDRITASIALHYSDNDWMSHPKDVEQLYNKLSHPIGLFKIKHPNFNHLDYVWGNNVRSLLYNPIIKLMKGLD